MIDSNHIHTLREDVTLWLITIDSLIDGVVSLDNASDVAVIVYQPLYYPLL